MQPVRAILGILAVRPMRQIQTPRAACGICPRDSTGEAADTGGEKSCGK